MKKPGAGRASSHEQEPPLWCDPVPPVGCVPLGQADAETETIERNATSPAIAIFFTLLPGAKSFSVNE